MDAVTYSVVQRSLVYNIHLATEEVFQILGEGNMIDERPVFVDGNEQVNVAGLARLAPGDGAENAHVPGAVSLGDPKNRFSPCHDVI
jgi:hypothetical protein